MAVEPAKGIQDRKNVPGIFNIICRPLCLLCELVSFFPGIPVINGSGEEKHKEIKLLDELDQPVVKEAEDQHQLGRRHQRQNTVCCRRMNKAGCA